MMNSSPFPTHGAAGSGILIDAVEHGWRTVSRYFSGLIPGGRSRNLRGHAVNFCSEYRMHKSLKPFITD